MLQLFYLYPTLVHKECREAKRLARRLLCASSAANHQADATVAAAVAPPDAGVTAAVAVAQAAAAKAAWYDQRRTYCQLHHQKTEVGCILVVTGLKIFSQILRNYGRK